MYVRVCTWRRRYEGSSVVGTRSRKLPVELNFNLGGEYSVRVCVCVCVCVGKAGPAVAYVCVSVKYISKVIRRVCRRGIKMINFQKISSNFRHFRIVNFTVIILVN